MLLYETQKNVLKNVYCSLECCDQDYRIVDTLSLSFQYITRSGLHTLQIHSEPREHHIMAWINLNFLQLNNTKTAILIGTRHHVKECPPLNVHCYQPRCKN